MMKIEHLLSQLKSSPESVQFTEVIATINENYHYTPTTFTNGVGEYKLVNEAGQNESSCRIFAFAKLHGLSKEQALACFGQHYRDVLATPHGTDHANIRAFMQYGWIGIHFDGMALKSLYN
jgi:hypothetical protein